MFQFNLKLLLRNKILWAWPIIAAILAVIIGTYSDIQSAGNSYSFLIAFGESPPFPSGFLIDGLIDFFILIAVIGIPSHLSKNIDPERASLIFSKPISRSDFFFSEFTGVMTVIVFYTLITNFILAVLLFVEAGIFPFQLYLAILLAIPLYFFVIYVAIVLLLVLTHSFLASVLIAYLLITPLSGLLYNTDIFLNFLGWNSELMLRMADGLSYLIPSTGGVDKLVSGLEGPGSVRTSGGSESFDQVMSGIIHNGFAAFDWQVFGFVMVSCLPFFLLSYYLMRRKEF